MAHTDNITQAALQSVAQQVGARLPSLAPGAVAAALAAGVSSSTAPALGESLTVYVLSLNAIQNALQSPAPLPGGAGNGIEGVALPTGQWHHQVRYGGRAQAFARSVQDLSGNSAVANPVVASSADPPEARNAGEAEVTALFASTLAERIDQAVDWIDQNVTGDPLVRLLIAPAYYLHALWLTEDGRDQLLVVDRPESMAAFQYQTLYDGVAFLRQFSTYPPVQGLPTQLPPPGSPSP
jgi:hypothetical protein